MILLLVWLMLTGAAQAQPGTQAGGQRTDSAPTARPVGARSNDESGQSEHGHSHAERPPALGPEQAAKRARRRFGGRVLNVVLERGPGGPYYRVKILEHGRVRVVDIDARR